MDWFRTIISIFPSYVKVRVMKHTKVNFIFKIKQFCIKTKLFNLLKTLNSIIDSIKKYIKDDPFL